MVVGDIIRMTAARYPKKTGVVFEDKRFTWQEANVRVNGLANALLKMGLKRGDRVAILSRNCNQYLEFYFAAAKAGLVAIPLNTRFIGRELAYLIKDSGANTLIVGRGFIDVVKGMSSELKQIKHYIGIGESHPYAYDFETLIRQHSPTEPEAEVDEEDLCVIAYTSGTTGFPRGAMLTHKNCVSTAIIVALSWRVQPYYNHLLSGAFFFAGFGQRAVPVLMGATSVIVNFEPLLMLQTIEKERISTFSMAPTMLNMLISHPDIGKYDLRSLRHIYITGAPLAPQLYREAEKILGPVINVAWGLTECNATGTVLYREEIEFEGPLSRRLGSIGKSMINTEVKVINEDGKEVAPDAKETGEIILRNGSVMKGYWQLPKETAETLKDGWLYTGDLATVDEDGYIYIVDRKKDVIKSGAVQIWPREIEDIIYSHPSVLHAAVIGVPDDKWGETPKVVIVLKPSAKATAEEIMELCKANLASYKKPSSVDFVDKLPLTPSGKVIKRELKEQYWKGYEKRVH